MKIVKYIKGEWLSWIIAIGLTFLIVYNEEISIYSGNGFVKYFTVACPFTIIILLFVYGQTLYGIEENLWDDFKKSKDVHIDKMMKTIKITFILLMIFNAFWLFLIMFNLTKSSSFNHIKSILLISIPISIVFFLSKNFYSLQKEYNS